MGGCWEFQECQGMSGMLRISVDTERHQVGEFRNVGNVSNVENVRRDRKT